MAGLFLDTSAGALSLAIEKEGLLVLIKEENEFNKMAEEAIPLIQEAAKEAGLSFDGFSSLFITDGPGSYTGERIGLTIGKTYCFLKPSVSLYLASSLKIMSAAAKDRLSLPLMDARNMACFGGLYLNGALQGEEKRLEDEEIRKLINEHPSLVLIGIGDFAAELKKRYPANEVISAKMTSCLFTGKDFFSKVEDPLKVKARYLRGKDERN
ncbi:MAG: tRNA (adenosine(37)-N6)-threonylcarbamoyltransferase complex dimerization subunit type 1 TsaB [Bacilli bacterium]|jgi:tRNA threonylcarbamoyl adenosine modification protein YeaZ|nr:tRNA (adenosine(37)-N6)-threonylcarbamoyltransferase complex dimerization subunit type 1 TsaB [Bacilli bacterium]